MAGETIEKTWWRTTDPQTFRSGLRIEGFQRLWWRAYRFARRADLAREPHPGTWSMVGGTSSGIDAAQCWRAKG